MLPFSRTCLSATIAVMMILQTSFLNDHGVEAFTPFDFNRHTPSSSPSSHSASKFGSRIMEGVKKSRIVEGVKKTLKWKITPETSADIYMNPGEEWKATTTFVMTLFFRRIQESHNCYYSSSNFDCLY